MTPPDPPESRRLSALTDLLRNAVKQPSEAELQHGLNALRARIAPQRVAPHWRWVAFTVAALAVVVLAVGVTTFVADPAAPSEPPLAVDKIEGGKLLDGGYLSGAGNLGITLFFNEGSRFELAPGARGRLRSVSAQGTRLAIEHGKASFRITESRDRRWSVEAGPFVVAVRGTDFAVVWDPAREELEVSLHRGRVAVSGPVVGDELVLRPGQRLTVSLPKRETVISEGSARPQPAASADVASQAPAAASAQGAVVGEAPSPPNAAVASASAAPSTERSWKAAIATGQWDRILADVERDGVATTLQTLSSEDLFALADAARYRRRTDLARAALLEQQRRFPNSPRSLDAMFLLARVEETGQGGKRLAIQRYREYLARAPGGTYSAEALGRNMVLTNEMDGAASARRIAEQYLQRFPNGSYAAAARALRQAP